MFARNKQFVYWIIWALLATPFTFIMLFVVGMGCDESCNPASSEWQDKEGAWQWTILGILFAMAWLLNLVTPLVSVRLYNKESVFKGVLIAFIIILFCLLSRTIYDFFSLESLIYLAVILGTTSFGYFGGIKTSPKIIFLLALFLQVFAYLFLAL